MSLGRKIAKLRKERDWNQDDLAQKVGVHGRHVTRWERDKIKPSAKTLARLAEVFEVTVDELTRENSTFAVENIIPDSELLAQFQAVTQFSDEEKNAVKVLLQAMIKNQQMKKLMEYKGAIALLQKSPLKAAQESRTI